jgi:pyrimidine-nucleoside phosphorylase
MIPARIIERKRNGEVLTPSELEAFLLGYLDEDVQEPQMAAFLMAVYFRGLDPRELDTLVDVMLHSGGVLDAHGIGGPVVDKHSTGGVGDKVSLPLAPLAAALGLVVPMISGRGLGHTGGTRDKLESIPGFRTDLTTTEVMRVLERVGCVIAGQTEQVAPLDRRLYALRDITGTVSSIPLISASIMSKKLAEGLDGLVLDVKVGEGAFIPEEARALELARTMTGIGVRRGVRTRALLTAMDRPLGRAIGNALEVVESVECLRGEGPPDLRELVLELGAEMLGVGGVTEDLGEARARAEAALDSGAALERFRRMVQEQGGDPGLVDDPSRLPKASESAPFRAERAGFVSRVTPSVLGMAIIEMGGGRRKLGDPVDPSVGFMLHVEPGQRIERGETLATVHASDRAGLEVGLKALSAAVQIVESREARAALLPLVSARVEPELDALGAQGGRERDTVLGQRS